MSGNEINAICENASKAFVYQKGRLRFGQALFNAADEYVKAPGTQMNVENFEALRGSPVDCFYQDANVSAFLQALEEI